MLTPDSVSLDDGDIIREGLAEVLEKRGGTLDGSDPAFFEPQHRRLQPGRCKAPE
jgi:hypothetical protein